MEPSPFKEPRRKGYCTHGTVLFPTWHRPYVALFEVRTESRGLTHTITILIELNSKCCTNTPLKLPKGTRIKPGGHLQPRTFERLTGIGLLVSSHLPRLSPWSILTSSSPRVRSLCRTPCFGTNSNPSTRPSNLSQQGMVFPSRIFRQRSDIPKTVYYRMALLFLIKPPSHLFTSFQ